MRSNLIIIVKSTYGKLLIIACVSCWFSHTKDKASFKPVHQQNTDIELHAQLNTHAFVCKCV